MNRKNIFKNSFISFITQVICIAFGLIIPRIFIINYGSDVNGLLSTLTQIFVYLSLLEAGIGNSMKVAIYKPLRNDDKQGIIDIYYSAQLYYRKITFYYIIGVVVMSILLPFFIKTNVNKNIVFWATIIEGISGAIVFYYFQTQSVFLKASGKDYIVNIINLFNKILSNIVKLILAYYCLNIIFLQLSYLIITVSKLLLLFLYFNKHYSWLCNATSKNIVSLPNRIPFMITELSWVVFSSTDMLLLSLFVNTAVASIYSVYNMIFSHIALILNSIYLSISYVIGYAYYGDKNKFLRIHDSLYSFFVGSITGLMSVAYILCIPFIKIYTKGVIDVNYVDEKIPIFFCLIQIISWSRYVIATLDDIAGYAKMSSYISIFESFINIILSIILVKPFGIVGVLIGSVAALPLKVIWHIYISNIKVLHRSIFKSLLILLANYVFFTCIVVINKFIKLFIYDYIDFIIHALIITLLVGILVTIINIIINPELLNSLKYILKIKKPTFIKLLKK